MGACVGIRGVRIQAIVRELHDEKIDVIEWNADPSAYIAKALSPARVVGVYLNDKNPGGKTATVVVPEDQLSLAIGRDGQNARLAAKLTSWRIDIKSLPEAAGETMIRIKSDAVYETFLTTEADLVGRLEGMLARKAEGRPLTPEEYDVMAQFVDRVERRTAAKKPPEKKAEEMARQEVASTIPAWAFEQNILDSKLPEHVATILQGAGYLTTGDLLLQIKTGPDDILRLQGIGPRSMQEIFSFTEAVLTLTGEQTPVVAAETSEETPVSAVVEPEAVAPIDVPASQVVTEEATGVETPVAVETTVSPVETAQPVAEGEEEEATFDELFTLRPEVVEQTTTFEEEEESDSSDSSQKGKKKGKKKRKSVEIEYDPDRDLTIVYKKHKRGEGEWEWEE